MITAIDLFCGVGGLAHGLARSGIHVVAGIDIDPKCRFPFERNNASEFIERDVRATSGEWLRSLWTRGAITLLAGCAPCQPYSTYSRRGRHDRTDSKWELLFHFGRLVQESRPDLVTMENVPQVLDHPAFTPFLACLAGYKTWHRVVQCADYGVPQTRKRLVLLASRLGPICLDLPRLTTRPTVRSAISKLKAIVAGASDPTDPLHAACSLSDINLRRIRASVPGGTWRDWDDELVAACHMADSGATYPAVYGRMEWDAPAPTITTQCYGYGNGRFGHPEQDRAISLREAALLQTFPRSYRFLRPGERPCFNTLGRLIGNAVPVRLGEAVGRSVMRHAEASRRSPRT